jgi:2-keto-3-deoxy-L-rhamnonate aldolase RhmA
VGRVPKQLRDGNTKLTVLNSQTVAEQLAHSGYDWLLVDTQHGPMGPEPELGDATNKLIAAARTHGVILGIFLFGTSRVAEFLGKGFRFFSVGNDLHHILTQPGAYVKDVEGISVDGAAPWTHRSSALI